MTTRYSRIMLCLCLFLLMLTAPALALQPFPDTGQTKCYNNNRSEEIPCPAPGEPFYGQDAQYQPRLPRHYTKLGVGDVELPPDALHFDDGGPWVMTRDNVTGLIWEIKSRNPGLQYNRNAYTWYDPDDPAPGTQNGGTCTGSDCDTYSYIQALNAQEVGGFSDWRMPTVQELASLVNAGVHNPAIDVGWFPNELGVEY